MALRNQTRQNLLLASLAVLVTETATAAARPPEPQAASCVVRADLSSIINAATAEYIDEALTLAEDRGCALLAVIDTPGGDLEATRRIVQRFLRARTPVISFVAPSGARAGSAGMLVALSAHVAAMAPGTTIGAAHPVVGLGKDPEEVGGEHLGRKIENDVAALARAIAQQRGRDVEWAEAAVRQSVSATAGEAEARGVIDRIVSSERELLADIHEMVIATTAGPVMLATRDAEVAEHEKTLSQRVRSTLGNPSVVYVLLMVGVLGLVLELSSPGLVIRGIVGGLALLLAAVGINLIPVNASAVLFLVLGTAMVIGEMFLATYGVLAIAGVALLGLGATFLVDRETTEFFADASFGVSWAVVVPTLLVVAAAALALAWSARRLYRRGQVTGVETLIGRTGRVLVPIASAGESGQIEVLGERWRATADTNIEAGEIVRVEDVLGLTLYVSRETRGGAPWSSSSERPQAS